MPKRMTTISGHGQMEHEGHGDPGDAKKQDNDAEPPGHGVQWLHPSPQHPQPEPGAGY